MIRYGFLFSAFLGLLIVTGNPNMAVADDASNASQMVPMTGDAMAKASGGSEAAINSKVYDNVMGDAYSGNISAVNVTGNSGLTTAIQNTGNQVSIATATVVNVTFH